MITLRLILEIQEDLDGLLDIKSVIYGMIRVLNLFNLKNAQHYLTNLYYYAKESDVDKLEDILSEYENYFEKQLIDYLKKRSEREIVKVLNDIYEEQEIPKQVWKKYLLYDRIKNAKKGE
ncbi:MAG: hypothetical protein ABIL45_04190 [candidate division WOR-3 bacterium]